MSFIICGEKRKCGRQEGKNNSVSTLSSTDAQWAPSHLLESPAHAPSHLLASLQHHARDQT